jgi:hypothetical protein
MQVVSHNGITADLDAEESGEVAQPIENPGLTVRVITTGVRVDATQESSSDAASDAVRNAHTLLVDDLAAGRGRHVRGSVTRQVQHIRDSIHENSNGQKYESWPRCQEC